MSYIEIRAKRYASQNLNNFDKIIKEYEIDITLRYNQEYCNALYHKYKQICKFDNIIKVSYLFENNKDNYYKLKYGMDIINNRTEFKKLFLNDLANIYKTVFGKEYKRLGAIHKIEKANELIQQINLCIVNRIQYHYHCKNHQIKYNVKAHEHEILFSIYMYNKLIEITELLNIYSEKYKIFKEELQKKKQELEQEEEYFDNIYSESHTLSEEPFEINTNKKRTQRK